MNKTAQRLAYTALVVLMVGAAYGVQYMYLSDNEITVFGDRVRFWGQDTLSGPVHSNWQIAIMQNPVFFDQVTQAGPWDDFDHGSGYNPVFLGPPPIFHAIPVTIPEVLMHYRAAATHYFNPGSFRQMRCRIVGGEITLWTWNKGVAFDSTAPDVLIEQMYIDATPEILFFDAPLELMGFDITGDVVIAAAQTIRLMDDVRVAPPHDGPPTYKVHQSNPNFVVIASEGDIKVANTVENGRENCSGFGPAGTDDQSVKDIVITAALYALGNQTTTGAEGSLTFENQNDLDSGYVCECVPDERGVMWLYGTLTQRRRGYMHRSNNGGTGYARRHRYDERWRTRYNWVIDYPPLDTVNFGNVVVGTTAYDTAEVYMNGYGQLGLVTVNSSFFAAQRIPPFYGTHFRVPVSFTPPTYGQYYGMLYVQTSQGTRNFPLRGRGVQGSGPGIARPAAYPNPFNASTTFTFALPQESPVRLEVFDVLGRKVMTLLDEVRTAGEHTVRWDAAGVGAGVYFLRLEAPLQKHTQKVLLVK